MDTINVYIFIVSSLKNKGHFYDESKKKYFEADGQITLNYHNAFPV